MKLGIPIWPAWLVGLTIETGIEVSTARYLNKYARNSSGNKNYHRYLLVLSCRSLTLKVTAGQLPVGVMAILPLQKSK